MPPVWPKKNVNNLLFHIKWLFNTVSYHTFLIAVKVCINKPEIEPVLPNGKDMAINKKLYHMIP